MGVPVNKYVLALRRMRVREIESKHGKQLCDLLNNLTRKLRRANKKGCQSGTAVSLVTTISSRDYLWHLFAGLAVGVFLRVLPFPLSSWCEITSRWKLKQPTNANWKKEKENHYTFVNKVYSEFKLSSDVPVHTSAKNSCQIQVLLCWGKGKHRRRWRLPHTRQVNNSRLPHSRKTSKRVQGKQQMKNYVK